jgi:aminoglycoside/choline kinase family phosphotransferase
MRRINDGLVFYITFFLPLEIRDFSHRTQQQIVDDILDQQVQQGKYYLFNRDYHSRKVIFRL